MATPLHIKIVLHYRVSAPEAGEYSRELMERGLLRRSTDNFRQYEPTEATKVWVEALCAVPFPTQKWVIE